MTAPRRVAVIGSGVAGLTAAHVAARTAHVTLYEADGRLGGHADTHDVDGAATWPSTPASSCTTSAPTRRCCGSSPRSASRPSRRRCRCRCATRRPAWSTPARSGRAGCSRPARNLPARRTSGCWPRSRASTAGPGRCSSTPSADDRTLRDFLADGGFTAYFRRHFMEPLVAAVWSCDPAVALDYPARYLFEFLAHHGMLSVTGSPQWRTVVGGSRAYVAKVAAGLDEVRLGTKVTSVRETAEASRSPTATARPRRTTRS